jgi:hypothetical protein
MATATSLRRLCRSVTPHFQGTFGIIQGTFGIIQGTFGIIQGTFGHATFPLSFLIRVFFFSGID